jgi:alkanesulfonate monooxygenase SsuD/methylene tetrahydromethanopterin reductase-like flavin-dependent oxidoreductase (luciferase family)
MVESERHTSGSPASASLGFGVIAGLARELLEPLAKAVAGLGFETFWVNDGGRPEADGLEGLAVVHAAAPERRLGVGVLPLDRRSPAEVAADVRRLALPLARLRLGVGSGGSSRPLELVRAGVAELRDELPTARVFIAALGPRMSRLAGEVADGVLFNWAVPSRLESLSAIVAEGEREAGRGPIERWAYVRAAVGPDARTRLAAEARRYARTPAYGRAFEAAGVPFEQVGVAGDDLAGQLRPYRRILDGVVVRALPAAWRLDQVVEIARSASGPPGEGPRG